MDYTYHIYTSYKDQGPVKEHSWLKRYGMFVGEKVLDEIIR